MQRIKNCGIIKFYKSRKGGQKLCENPTCFLEYCYIEYGYCHCSCGGKTSVSRCKCVEKGWLKGVPIRYIKGHNTRLSPIEYIINEETGCWEWQGHRSKKGYGLKKLNGITMGAHKYYYIQKYGPVPEGLVLDHFVCQNPGCVNPDHLEPVTNAENCIRGRGTKLTQEDVDDIRRLSGVLKQNKIALMFNISTGYTSCLIRNKNRIEG